MPPSGRVSRSTPTGSPLSGRAASRCTSTRSLGLRPAPSPSLREWFAPRSLVVGSRVRLTVSVPLIPPWRRYTDIPARRTAPRPVGRDVTFVRLAYELRRGTPERKEGAAGGEPGSDSARVTTFGA